MKQLLMIILILTSALGLYAESMGLQAQKEYQEGNFKKTIELLENEIKVEKSQRKVSADLYYNLGNAYFKTNDFPKAILNYERASLLDPGDGDIQHNLEYAQTKIEDKILTANNFFLQIWFNGVQNLMSSNGWAIFSVVSFILFIMCLFLFFFNQKILLKKVGFYFGVVLFVLLILSNIFAFRQKNRLENRCTAIVMMGSSQVAGSPATGSKTIFTLHAGTKVKIRKEDGNWYEIEIADGNIGWINKSEIEII